MGYTEKALRTTGTPSSFRFGKGTLAMPYEKKDGEAANRPSPAIRGAAERMRAHRRRRKLGLRCIMIQLRNSEIDVLVRRGWLSANLRNDRTAISRALHAFFDRSFGAAS
jgi:hypothetical protein